MNWVSLASPDSKPISEAPKFSMGSEVMADRFEQLLQEADFTKESTLYERLEKELFSKNTIDFMKGHRLPEKDLEMLAAAGNTDEVRLKKKDKG